MMAKAPPLAENEIQRAVFAHLLARGAPGVVAFHPKNGGIHQRGRHRGINAGLGVLSGVADVIVIAPPAATVYALELKKRGGKPSDEQIAFIEAVEKAGGKANWVDTLDDALAWLEWHGLLVGSTRPAPRIEVTDAGSDRAELVVSIRGLE